VNCDHGFNREGIDCGLVAEPKSQEAETIINLMVGCEYDLTNSDSHTLDLDLIWRDCIEGLLVVRDTPRIFW
jgi:hypothetical protein